MPHRTIQAFTDRFHQQKTTAEKAMAQLSFEQLKLPLDDNTNSIAIIAKHIAGNQQSRWTDFLKADGEKPSRQRDEEFIDRFDSLEQLMTAWDSGWVCLFRALEDLKDTDLERSVQIRGQPQTVLEATVRQLDHYAYHVGQIVLIARHHAKDNWECLSIPRGESETYNESVGYIKPDV